MNEEFFSDLATVLDKTIINLSDMATKLNLFVNKTTVEGYVPIHPGEIFRFFNRESDEEDSYSSYEEEISETVESESDDVIEVPMINDSTHEKFQGNNSVIADEPPPVQEGYFQSLASTDEDESIYDDLNSVSQQEQNTTNEETNQQQQKEGQNPVQKRKTRRGKRGGKKKGKSRHKHDKDKNKDATNEDGQQTNDTTNGDNQNAENKKTEEGNKKKKSKKKKKKSKKKKQQGDPNEIIIASTGQVFKPRKVKKIGVKLPNVDTVPDYVTDVFLDMYEKHGYPFSNAVIKEINRETQYMYSSRQLKELAKYYRSQEMFTK